MVLRALFQPPSKREANISPVTAGTKAPHNQNTLTFEPNPPPFTAITLTGQIIPALNFSKEFLRECVPQIAFFRTFFSKKKVHKGTVFAESSFRRRLLGLLRNPANPPVSARPAWLASQTGKSPLSARPANACAFANPPAEAGGFVYIILV